MASNKKDQEMKGNTKATVQYYNNEYFVFPHIVWIIAIPFTICLLFMSTFSPESALQYLPPPLSNFIYYMGKSHAQICYILCIFTVVVHCVEAAYAGKVCQDKRMTFGTTAKWSFMTFIFGFASLTRLNAYKPDKKDQ